MPERGPTPPTESSTGDWPNAAPPAGVVIRPAQPGDAASHVRLWTAVVAERRWMGMEVFDHGEREYRRLFRDSVSDAEARLAAVAGDEVVGSLRIARISQPVHRHVAFLTMAVGAAWRGKGIGAALLCEALKWARSAGLEKVTLDVYASNSAAIALYRNFGFTEEGRLRRHSKKSYGYEDQIMMARWLTGESK